MELELTFENRVYKLNKDKLIFVLSKLENKKLPKNLNSDELIKFLGKYKLFDKYFLANLNNI